MRTWSRMAVWLAVIGLTAALASMVLAACKDGCKGPCCASKGEDKDVKVAWTNLPAAVQATIQAKAEGATVTEVEKEVEEGKTTYEAKVTGRDGKTVEIKVAEDGTFIESEADDDKEKKGEDVEDRE